MTTAWSPEELDLIGRAEELEIAAKRADGTLRRWVPIWVVCDGEQAYVRTWHRRDTGWFGQVVESRRAKIRVPGLEVDVAVEDVGADQAERRAGVDAAYRRKYGHYGGTSVAGMVTEDAVASTLRLIPELGSPAAEAQHGPVLRRPVSGVGEGIRRLAGDGGPRSAARAAAGAWG